jgi:hypothetical protein
VAGEGWPLAPSRARSKGGSLVPVAAKDSRINSRAESLEVAKVTSYRSAYACVSISTHN